MLKANGTGSNAVKKIKDLFLTVTQPLTSNKIQENFPELKMNQISMALSYLVKQKYLTRELINSTNKFGRKSIYNYTYNKEELQSIVIHAENSLT